jgi:NhaP-type Na+/H+ or K+/H+ antiporter
LIFIAPLLFYDGKHANKKSLWSERKNIVSMAMYLVILTVVILGFIINWLVPALNLAASFALAAALSPTDYVAVSALSKKISLPQKVTSIIEGEGLMNDASGLVCFKFAMATALTGTFSLFSATANFFAVSIGGLLIGIILMYLFVLFEKWINGLGMEDITVEVLIHMLTPFIVYMIAEEVCGVSGVLAVVAAGMVYSLTTNTPGSTNAKIREVSENTWSVLVYVLNGFVFTMVGFQLPKVIQRAHLESSIDIPVAMLYAGIITFVLLLLRFLWVLLMYSNDNRRDKEMRRQTAIDREKNDIGIVNNNLSGNELAVEFGMLNTWEILQGENRFEASETSDDKKSQEVGKNTVDKKSAVASETQSEVEELGWFDALLTTLAGVRGSVTLATVMSIPLTMDNGMIFPNRDLILFLAVCVILITLMIATFVLPIIAKKDEQKENDYDKKLKRIQIKIWEKTIDALNESESKNPYRGMAIAEYRYQINQLNKDNAYYKSWEFRGKEEKKLLVQCFKMEIAYINKMVESGDIDEDIAEECENILRTKIKQESRGDGLSLRVRKFIRARKLPFKKLIDRSMINEDVSRQIKIQTIHLATADHVIGYLSSNMDDSNKELYGKVIGYYNGIRLMSRRPIGTKASKKDKKIINVKALEIERKIIQEMFESGSIGWTMATELRKNLNYIESDTLK